MGNSCVHRAQCLNKSMGLVRVVDLLFTRALVQGWVGRLLLQGSHSDIHVSEEEGVVCFRCEQHPVSFDAFDNGSSVKFIFLPLP